MPRAQPRARDLTVEAGGTRARAARDDNRAGTDTIGTLRGAASAGSAAAPPLTRELSALDAEFRARLERVLERMRGEFGHRVEVVETQRSQWRQDSLYAQGRTRSGPVVTWTRNSAHLGGYAADVVVDDNPGGGGAVYGRLAVVAREEGLRTLGPRDPGHLELPRAGGRAGYASAAFGSSAFADAAGAPAGSARSLARIVSSGGVAPSGPTVFAASPYASALTGSGASFLGADEPGNRANAYDDAAPVAEAAAVAQAVPGGGEPARNGDPARERMIPRSTPR